MTTEEKRDEYYAAVLIFESRCPAPDYAPLFEEQVVLLRASSEEDAKAKVEQYAKGEAFSYKGSRKRSCHQGQLAQNV